MRCIALSLPSLLFAAFSVAASAPASYVCVDEVGFAYRMAQPMAAQLAKFTCTMHAPPSIDAAWGDSAAARRPVQSAVVDRALVDQAVIVNLDIAPRRRAAVELTRARFGRMSPIDSLIIANANEFQHDPFLLKAIIHVESSFNTDAVSPKGALGLMQIMPATGRRFGVADPQRELFGPATNIRVGARYLRELRDMFSGRLELAVAAYNAGENAVVRHGHRIPPYPETQEYVRRVLRTYNAYRRTAAE
jgi:soluble lytic murein transglycosylase-like protein